MGSILNFGVTMKMHTSWMCMSHTRERPFIYSHVQRGLLNFVIYKNIWKASIPYIKYFCIVCNKYFFKCMTYIDILKYEIALCQRPVHTVLNPFMMNLVWKVFWKSILESNLFSAWSVKSHFQKLPIWRSILRFILEKININVTFVLNDSDNITIWIFISADIQNKSHSIVCKIISQFFSCFTIYKGIIALP